MSPTPADLAKGAVMCAALDQALDDIMPDAREALIEHGPVQARAEVTIALLMTAAMGRADSVAGIAATAILRLIQREQIDEATAGATK
jgi:hypothetical protein